MNAWVPGLLALAALLSPCPSVAVARVRTRPDAARSGRRRRPAFPARRYLILPALAFGAAAVGAASLAGGAPLLPALAGSVAGGAAGLLVSRAAARRQRRRQHAAAVEFVAALAADIRAGQQPSDALASATTVADLDPRFLASAIDAVWAVSARSGAPVATVLDRMEQDLRARIRQRREVAAQLAGARATAALLAFLPVLGIGLGTAMGARPLQVLFGAPAGQVSLVVGVGLDAVGVLWTAGIVRRAGGDA